jgi:membrane-associated phospholipid phosphatase
MIVWHVPAIVFFFYTAALALTLRGLSPRRRLWASGAALAGIGATAFAAATPLGSFLHDWLLPPSVLLIAYWSSGCLFVSAMPRVERAFLDVDRAFRVPELAAMMTTGVVEILELAYVGVYVLIPIALALQLAFSPDADPDRFWTVILLVDFICFAMLPWIQTRPPRALELRDPWSSSVRAHNLRLLGATSIQVNTFPSGHAAEALAAALLVTSAPTPIVILMFIAALAVAAGAVLGRYHYLVDAVSGWLVAIAICVALA